MRPHTPLTAVLNHSIEMHAAAGEPGPGGGLGTDSAPWWVGLGAGVSAGVCGLPIHSAGNAPPHTQLHCSRPTTTRVPHPKQRQHEVPGAVHSSAHGGGGGGEEGGGTGLVHVDATAARPGGQHDKECKYLRAQACVRMCVGRGGSEREEGAFPSSVTHAVLAPNTQPSMRHLRTWPGRCTPRRNR